MLAALKKAKPQDSPEPSERRRILDALDLAERIISRQVDRDKAGAAGRDLPRQTVEQMWRGKAANSMELALLILSQGNP
jgi:hypothetical protein